MNNDLFNGNGLNGENPQNVPQSEPSPTEETIKPAATESSESSEPAASTEATPPEAKADTETPTPSTETTATPSPASYVWEDEPQATPASHTYSSYNPAPTPVTPPKKEKKQPKGVSRVALAIICVCTVLLSCASGFFGAYLVTSNLSVNEESNLSGTDTSDPVVIYQSAASPSSGMSADNGSASYYNVAELVKASVVEITTEHLVNSYFQYVTQGAGSGIILSADGYILTNNHVIVDDNGEIAGTITVRMTTGEEFKATVIGSDADSDIAVLKIEAENLPAVIVGNSDALGVGEEVIAVGNPLGELGGTVTNGIISALDREINVDGTMMNLLQTNTAINPGNSGGGLFNMAGELIGVVNAKSSGTGIEGLGFAIPVNDAVSIAEQLITSGYVSGKPYLGVTFYNVTSYSEALYYGLKHLGVYIVGLEGGMNDDVFEIGDRVIAVDGNEISSHDDIKAVLKSHEVGDKIIFIVYRNGKMREIEATCYEWVPESSSVEFEE